MLTNVFGIDLDFRTTFKTEVQKIFTRLFLTENYPDDFDESFKEELVQFRELLKQTIFKARESRELQMHRLINDNSLRETFPDASVALRMYLSLMIANCSRERSFSVLKSVKNQTQLTMVQIRLNTLSLLCIVRELFSTVETGDIIEKFGFKKSCNVIL